MLICIFILGIILGDCEIPDTIKAGVAFHSDKSSYRYGGDTIFLPLKSGTIDEGSSFCYFTEFVMDSGSSNKLWAFTYSGV